MLLNRTFVAASLILLAVDTIANESAYTAVWAQSSTQDALRWSGAKADVRGLLHSNGEITVTGAKNNFTGGAHWVSGFDNNKDSGPNANIFDPPATQVSSQPWPRDYSLSAYMPGGAAAIAAGSGYVDLTNECQSAGNVSLSFQNEDIPGNLYWSPCDISITVKDSIAAITVVSTGKFHLNVHKDSQLNAFLDGRIALSEASGHKAIHVNGNRSELHGDLIARYGEIHIAGSRQTFSCGVFADTVKVSGSNLALLGDDCDVPTSNAPPIAADDSAETTEDIPVIIALLANDGDFDGQLVPSSVAVVSPPANGTVSIDPLTGDATYQPDADFFGSDAFDYTVADDDGAVSQPATVTISVDDLNDPPTAANDQFFTEEDIAVEVDVLTNDFDIDGTLDVTTVAVIDAPANGTTVVDAVTGLVTYTPDLDFFGEDEFDYTVADDDGAVSAVATAVVSVASVNDAPIPQPDIVIGDEDTAFALDLLTNDIDVDSVLTGDNVVISVPPTNGQVAIDASGTITYLPNPDYFGADSFEYSLVDDGGLPSVGTALVTITVDPVNDAPVASDTGVTVAEDDALAVTLDASDVEGDAIGFTIIDQPTSGVLSGTAPDLVYTPIANFFGSDSFTFVASDGQLDSSLATVTVTVLPVNDIPVIVDQSFAGTEDTALDIMLDASDVDGDTLTTQVISGPQNGSISGTGTDLQYSPDPDFNGTDSFVVVLSDNSSSSDPATITVNIDAVNDAPVADDQSGTTIEDTSLVLLLTGSDVDADSLTFAVATSPANGTLSGIAPNLTYTPNPDYNGDDSFTFTVSDGLIQSAPATVQINVAAENDAPTATPLSLTTDEDVPIPVILSGSDVDGDALTFSIETQPVNGTLGGTVPNLTYTPAADFNGIDSFTYIANDGVLDSTPAIVDIAIAAINDSPIADDIAAVTPEDTAVDIVLMATDADGDALSFAVQQGPSNGTLSGSAPNLTYLPNADFSGTDSFTYFASDGTQNSALATVTITVDPINDAPIADPQSITTAEDTAVSITLTGSDPENDPLSFTVTGPGPVSGTLSGTAPDLTYSPDADFNGADSFTFVASDGVDNSPEATITITVTAVNDPPVADPNSVTTAEDTAVGITLSGTDPEGAGLSFTITVPPSSGTLSGAEPNLTYAPDPNFFGSDSLTYVVNDGTIDSSPADVDITVTPVNDIPIATSFSVDAVAGQPIPIVLAGQDDDNDALTFSIETQPSNGTLTGPPDNLTYTADAAFAGTDQFTFIANDGTADSAPGTVTINVAAGNAPPEFTRIPLLNAPLGETYKGLGAAIDPDGGNLTFALTAGPLGSSLIDLGNGEFRIDWLSAGAVGDSVPFTVTATDPAGTVAILNLAVTVTGPRINVSHLGTDFWLAFGSNFRNFSFSLGQMPADDPGRSLQVVIGAPEGATGTVEAVGVGIVEPFTVAAGESVSIDLPTQIMAGVPAFQGAIRRPDGGPPGVRVLSDEPITVAGVNWAFATTDAWLALPTDTLGTQYMITGYRDDLFRPNNDDLFWGLVATQDNTTITITPLETLPQRVNQALFDPQTYTANAGQVVTGILRYAASAEVVADQPIAMFGGSSCADVPIGVGTCDHLWQQFVPTTSLASEYLAAPLATRTASLYRVIAEQDDTRVFINGVYSAFLDRGQNVDVQLSGPISISGSRPITAIQYAIGNQFDSVDRQDDLADPFMLNLAPVDSFLTDYTVVVPGGEGVFRDQPNDIVRPPIENHFISVVLPATQADSLYLDGALVDTSAFEPIPGSGYLAGAIQVAPGTYNLAANEQFGVTVYGWGFEESYGHYAGLIFPSGSTDLVVDATGPTAALVAGSEQACIDVTVTDTGGARVPRARYTLDITGTVPVTHTGFADRVGQARFCYTQAQAGTDNVTVAVAGDNAVLAVDWLPNSDPGTNGAPAITSFPELVLYEQTFTYSITSVDPDGDIVGYSLMDAPNGASIVNGVLSWTPVVPADREPTTHLFTLIADDGNGGTDEQRFELKVYYPAIFVEDLPFTRSTQLFSREFGTTFDHIGGDPNFLVANMIEGSGTVFWAGILGTTPVFNIDGRTQFIQQREYTDQPNLMCRADSISTGQISFRQVWRADLFDNIRFLVAGPVLDTNGDQAVDTDDDIYAALAQTDSIILFNLTTQSIAWQTPIQTLYTGNYVAITNLDADIDQEVLAVVGITGDNLPRLTAFDADGSILWRSTHNPYQGDFTGSTFEMPVLPVDLDNNGATEILLGPYVYDRNGNLLWQFDDTRIGSTRPRNALPLAADLDNDGRREVLFANEVRDTDGSLLWSLPYSIATRRPQVFYAVANLTGDSDLEIVASISTENGTFTEAFSADGQRLWPAALTDIGFSMPVVTDFDRDGDIDIFSPFRRTFINADGVVEAQDPGGSGSNIVQQITDLDRDGIPERLGYGGSWRLTPAEIFSDVRWQARDFRNETNNFSTTRVWQPAVWVDADHDGASEMYVAGFFGTAMYESAGRPFPLMTRRYSQVVDFDQPVIGFDTDFGTPTNYGLPDAWVGRIRFDQIDEQDFDLNVEVRNKGMAPINTPVTVQFFSGRPDGTGTLIGEVTVPGLPVNSAQTVSIPATYDDRDFVMSARLVFDPTVAQCDVNNDAVEGELHTIEMRDGDLPYRINRYSYLHQEDYAHADISLFSAPTNTTITLGQTYTFDMDAGWNDTESSYGDSILYIPTGSTLALGMSVNAFTGEISWTPTFGNIGVNSFSIDARTEEDTATRNFTIEVVPRPNADPVITSTPILDALTGQTYVYDVEATDADGDDLVYSLDAAPLGMSIDADTGLITWTPDAGQSGANAVAVSVDDGFGGVATQSYSVLVNAGSNTPPSITSIPPFMAKATFELQYQVVADDADGDPLAYSVEQGPAGMVIDGNGLLSWTPPAAGAQSIVVRVSDGQAFVDQGWTLQVSDASIPLIASLSVNPTVAELNSTVQFTVGVSGAAGPISTSLNVDGVAVPVDPLSGQASYVADTVGVRTATAIVSDPYSSDSATVQFSVIDSSAGSSPPIVSLVAPDFEEEVTAPIDAIGTIDDPDDDLQSWFLALQRRGADPTEFTTIASGTGEIPDGVIGQIDPTMLLNGLYSVILQATDDAGNTAQDVRVIRVTGSLKVGNFSMTFEDLTVPVAGIPITVTRTYDTRQRSESLDFGFGWTIDYQDIRLQESRDIGFSWSLVEEDFGILSQFCVRPNGDPTVTIRLPDGEVETFVARAEPECTIAVPEVNVSIVFDPIDNTESSLEQVDFGLVELINGNIADPGQPGVPIDPDEYRLTTPDGYVWELDQNFGARVVTDPNQNSITYSDFGIQHSQGFSLEFIRDSEGRITTINAPDGTGLAYDYDANGDLIGFTNQVDERTDYTYTDGIDHYLENIIDPRGIAVARNEYDDDGRLIAIVDASGNRVEYEHDIVGRTEIIRDRRGNPTVYVYDDEGNVLTETNALGETITRTYDGDRNELTVTNDLGETTSFTYDSRGNALTRTNAEMETVTSTFDDRNRLLTLVDEEGITVVDNVYDPNNSNLLSTTDGEGKVTTLLWDSGFGSCSTGASRGHIDAELNTKVIQPQCVGPFAELPAWEEDERGVRTSFQYDDMGRVTRETTTQTDEFGVPQTQDTIYEYDNMGRLFRTTDPEGDVITYEYNNFGKERATIDGNLERTEFDYDERGNLILTRYPDGTTEEIGYDEEDNVIFEIDRLNRITRMTYDAANRHTSTIFPDDTPGDDTDNPRTRIEYDRAGRITARIDELGNRTEYENDRAGRQIIIRDALMRETRIEYDERGLKVAEIDPLNRRTEFVYDRNGRPIETIFPDDTPGDSTDNLRETIAYDGLGRKVALTDRAGNTTRFDFDKVGNITVVTDALGEETVFTYDEQSNVITQTDAEQRTTRWAYDLMGRITSRTLPEGQTESFGYDSSSNLDRHTDFNSATHIFDYDSLDRRISEMYADGSFVTTVYTLTDQVEAVVEARGTTSYTYDERDRLIRIVHPNGKAIDYGYDDAGNQTLLRTVNQSINYTYDALNRLETVTDEGGVTRYFYDAVGNLEAINHANGTRTEHDYDALDRLIEIRQYDGNDGLMDRHVYVLDDAGNRLRHTELSGRIVDYTYDDIYRLQTETVTDPMLGDRTTTYDHDRVGNVVSEVVTTSGGSTTTTYTYDDNDRLITESATGLNTATTTRSYDSNGNEVSRTDGTTTTFYGFDSRNRLVDLNNGQVTYEYDAMGNRQSKTAAGLTTVYLVDAARPFAQVIEESADLNVVADVRYTHGIDLLRQNRRLDAVTTVSKTYHYDGLGSTRQLTDEAGVVSDSYTFSAYGELDASNGATANSYLYAGEQFDGDLDFYYLRSRYYDSGVGRFQSLDTFDGNIRIPLSFNKYLYTHANPVNGIDPSGESLLSLVTQAPWGVTGRTISISAGRRALRKTFSNVLPFLNRKALQREIRNCRQRNKNCKIAVATLLLGSPTGEATEHVFDAQWGNSETAMRPSGFWFRYKDRRGNRSWYRNKEGCKAEDRAEAAVRAKTLLIDCDEFPFFKGTKAGPRFFPGNVSLRAISGSDNRSAGAMYGVLTRIAGLKRNPRERFVVIAWSGFDFSAPLPLNKWTKGK